MYKIGSGDMHGLICLKNFIKKEKVLLATGASNISDVHIAIDTIKKFNSDIVLMQCNTNYTGSDDNFKFINLNVLKLFSVLYPEIELGL